MAQRITEDFVRHYDLLLSRTGNSPSNVGTALNRNPQLAASIRELDRILDAIKQYRRFSKQRFIVQTHRRFLPALADYEKRWSDRAMMAVMHWEAEQRGEETPSQWWDRLLDELKQEDDSLKPGGYQQEEPLDWEFDPDNHSVASAIELGEEVLRAEANYSEDAGTAACSRAAGALKWLRESVGIDFGQIGSRWTEFPVFVVPKHISDKHGIEDPCSLFGYLTQIRLAYVAGADLAAIAMCRAVTEILIRFHYNQDDTTTDLVPLIRSTQQKGNFGFLKTYNLIAKVKDANDMLHFNRDDIKSRDRSGNLIRDWVRVLQDMIVKLREKA